MTRLEMETGVANWLNKAAPASQDALTRARIQRFLYDSVRDVLTRSGMEPLRATTATFASVADQDAYGLPLQFSKIDRITDRDNYQTLTERDMGWLRVMQPNPAPSGTPYAWVPYGWQAVQLQPSNASELFVKSSSASDTTQTATIGGFLTGGLARNPTGVTLTGTTAVSFGASITTWEDVRTFSISAVGVGVISLHEDSGAGTTLAQIPIGKTSSRYQSIRLWPTPSAARTYHVDGIAALTDLATDTAAPPCPEDFHETFVFGACMRECARLADGRTAQFEAWYERNIGRMRGWVTDNASLRLVPHAHQTGRSNLGAFYPADGWF